MLRLETPHARETPRARGMASDGRNWPRGCVYIVGAGPGHPGLITERGLACLRRADVVVYDRLVPPALLAEAPPDAERICAAKSSGRHRLIQREIEALLIARARAGHTVVRLKGGDPFIFGRGGEEALALQEAGIPWEVVPGVSSASAVPAAAGIPLTHRGVADGFAVWTAQRGDGTPARVLDAPTQVILMGLGSLRQTVADLLAHGRAPDTPAAVISWGTTSRQRAVRATLRDIALKVEQAGLEPPAVVVVGPAVALSAALGVDEGTAAPSTRAIARLALCWPGSLPGEGVYRRAGAGAEVFSFPLYRHAPAAAPVLARAAAGLARYRGVLFTHRAAVEALMEARLRQGKDLRELHGTRLWAANEEAAAALRAYGAIPDGVGLAAETGRAPARARRGEAFLVCGRPGDQAFVEALRERGVPGPIEFLAAAVVEPLPQMVRALQDMAAEAMIDAIAVDDTASHVLKDALGPQGWADLKERVRVEFVPEPAVPVPPRRSDGLAAKVLEAVAGWVRRTPGRTLEAPVHLNSVRPGR